MSGLSREELSRLAEVVGRTLGVHISVDEREAEDRLAETIASISDENLLERLLSDFGTVQDVTTPQQQWAVPEFKAKPGRHFLRGTTELLPVDEPTFADQEETIAHPVASGPNPSAKLASLDMKEGVSLSSFLSSFKRTRADLNEKDKRILLASLESLEKTRLHLEQAAVCLRREVYSSYSSRIRIAAYLALGFGADSYHEFNDVDIRVSEDPSSDKPTFDIVLGDFQMKVESAERVLALVKAHFYSPLARASLFDAARTKLSEASYQMAACIAR